MTLLILFGTQLAFAKTEASCTCSDPDYNVVIDPAVYPTGATLSELQGDYPFLSGNSMTNTCLSIQGHLKINRNFTINGGEVIMGPGAKITVVGNKNFTLSGVDDNGGMHGCTNMWAGIRHSEVMAGTISVINSIIQDAAIAVDSRTFIGSVDAMGSKFTNNYIGIYVGPIAGGGPFAGTTSAELTATGNLFEHDGGYLPPYSGQPSQIDGPGVIYNFMGNTKGVGIVVMNGDVSIGNVLADVNKFHGLSLGIDGADAKLTIRNCEFKDILNSSDPTGWSPSQFQGIRIQGVLGRSNEPEADIAECEFTNCTIGIYSLRASLEAKGNSFSCRYGIRVMDPGDQVIDISGNAPFASARPIAISGVGTAQSINISDNELEVNSSFYGQDWSIVGITINGFWEHIRTVEDFTISGNTISLSKVPSYPFGGEFGILMDYAAGAVVEGNILNFEDENIYGGIWLASCMGVTIAEHQIPASSISKLPVRGITVYNSPATRVNCNTVEAKSLGIFFSGASGCGVEGGSAVCTEVNANDLEKPSRNSVGLRLWNAVISPQIWRGNAWYDVDLNDPTSIGARYDGEEDLVAMSEIVVHTEDQPFFTQAIANGSLALGQLWFTEQTNSAYVQCPVDFGPEEEEEIAKDVYRKYAQSAFSGAGYGEGAQWIAERHLLRSLAAKPALASGDTLLAHYYTAAQAGKLGTFLAIDQEAKEVVYGGISASQQDSLEDGYSQQAALEADMLELYADYATADSAGQVAIEQLIMAKHDTLSDVLDMLGQIHQAIEGYREHALQVLESQNAGIVPASLPDSLLQEVNGIALAHILQPGELSAAEELALEQVAAYCPNDGGDAVYRAWAMLDWLPQECDSLSLMQAPPTPPVAVSLPKAKAAVYPNPGSGAFFLKVPPTESGTAEFRLYALTGQPLMHRAVPAGADSALDLSALPGGLYFYEIWDGQERLGSGKLSKSN